MDQRNIISLSANPCPGTATAAPGRTLLSLALLALVGAGCGGNGMTTNNDMSMTGGGDDMSMTGGNPDGPGGGGGDMSTGGGGPDMAVVCLPAYDNVCSPDSWCFQQPLPQGNTLYAAVTIKNGGDEEVWAVGAAGMALHLTGQPCMGGYKWAVVPTGVRADLHGIWAAAANDIWAVGAQDGTAADAPPVLIHWDGTKWKSYAIAPNMGNVPATSLNSVWGSAANDVYAVGSSDLDKTLNVVLHYTGGATWTQVDIKDGMGNDLLPDLRDFNVVNGTAAGDVWVMGAAGGFGGPPTIIHWDGTAWKDYTNASATGDVFAMTLVGKSIGWAVGSGGLLLRWNGVSWTVNISPSMKSFYSIKAKDSKDITAVGDNGALMHWDGISWKLMTTKMEAKFTQYALTNRWIVGDLGGMLYRDDVTNDVYRLATTTAAGMTGGGTTAWRAVHGTAADDLWFVGIGGSIQHWNGKTLDGIMPVKGVNVLNGVYAVAPDNIWAVGDMGFIVHSTDGKTFTAVTSGVTSNLNGIHGVAKDDIWAVGLGVALKYDGTNWTKKDLPKLPKGEITKKGFWAVWAQASKNVWIGGESGLVLRWDGTALNIVTGLKDQFGSPLFSRVVSVWGSSDKDVWLGDDSGETVHFDGSKYDTWPTAAFGQVSSIFGFSSTDIWAVGGTGTIMHYDGTKAAGKPQWKVQNSGTRAPVTAIWGASGNDMWVGGQGLIVRRKLM